MLVCWRGSVALTAGTLEQVINEHTAPVFTLRWNKRGDLVITGSADKGTKVLDAHTWQVKQTFTPHSSKDCQCMPAWMYACSANTQYRALLILCVTPCWMLACPELGSPTSAPRCRCLSVCAVLLTLQAPHLTLTGLTTVSLPPAPTMAPLLCARWAQTKRFRRGRETPQQRCAKVAQHFGHAPQRCC
jgi:hypothetical protein